MNRTAPPPLFWKLPPALRRSWFALRHPRTYRALRDLRTADPEPQNAPTFKPFLESNSLFIHIPKAAGISLGHGLFGRHTGNHTTLAEYEIAFTRAELDRFFKFTFVRNPWDRLVSAFLFLKKGGRNESDRRWAEEHLDSFDTFDDFVVRWVARENLGKGIHFLPQHRFITTPSRTDPAGIRPSASHSRLASSTSSASGRIHNPSPSCTKYSSPRVLWVGSGTRSGLQFLKFWIRPTSTSGEWM
jgi:hypothetical protein